MIRPIRIVICLLALQIGCSSTQTGTVPDSAVDQVDVADTTVDLTFAETLGPEVFTQNDLSELPDLWADLPLCTPGSGCFMDPCDEPADCPSGFCVEHMGDLVCSVSCLEECPNGWECRQVVNPPDVVWVCISPWAHLCRPCASNADCTSQDGVEDACLSFGDEGSFCGADCSQKGVCPPGFACKEAKTVSGGDVVQCLPDKGICDCSPTAIALGLTTPCRRVNEWGECGGLRMCSQAGLSACDAPEPAAEICNGLDDDCNGQTDDVSCDDGNPCTLDECDPLSGCTHDILTGTECGDGNVCTLADHCQEGTCVGTPISCDDGNPCTDDGCNETGGCFFDFNSAGCDDSDPCTVADACQEGQCVGFPVDCACSGPAAEECAALEDGNACNGTLLCDTTTFPYQCAVDPVTVVSCPEPEGANAFCLEASCDPASGDCSIVPDHEGLACDDGNACTLDDRCAAGVCAGNVPINCNDGNPCTDDSCDPAAGCGHVPNTLACFDGSFCTVGDSCQDGTCQPGLEAADCDDGNVCTGDSCDPLLGCQHAALSDTACDDGNACTAVDACKLGLCVGSGVPVCDDGNVCTTDQCDPLTGCIYSLNQVACDDSNLCTIGDHCHLGACISSGTLTCDDGNPCTDNLCTPAAGCQFVPNAAACDDDNPCTLVDVCKLGVCKGSGNLDCDDANPCTKDTCDAGLGCQHVAQPSACSDGDPCTVNDSCQTGSCLSGTPKECGDGNPCTDDACGPGGLCQHAPNEAACDDGNPCTQGDHCANGACSPTGAKSCDDGNACTKDVCVGAGDCLHAAEADMTPCGPWPWRCKGGKCGCIPDCEGMNCGDDGCGGTCGVCPPGQCLDGQCQCQQQCSGFVLPWGTWSYAKVLTVKAGSVAGNLNGFPVLVRLDADADLAAHARDDGFDLLFTTPGLVKLDYELERFSGDTGELVAWVRMDLVAGQDTVFYLYYGNPTSPSQANPAAVWDANFVGVWHMKDLNAKDSTVNGNHLTAQDAVTQDSAGIAGSAARFNGGQAHLHGAGTASLNQALAGSSAPTEHFTVSAWFRPDQVVDAASPERMGIVAYGGPFYLALGWKGGGAIPAALGKLGQYTVDYPPGNHNLLPGTWSTWAAGTWYFVVATFDRPTKKLYVYAKGGPTDSVSTTWNQELQDWWCDGLYIGRNSASFVGAIDEVRISKGPARSPEWIATEYANQADPGSFIIAGKEIALRSCGPDACGGVCGTCPNPADPCIGGLCKP